MTVYGLTSTGFVLKPLDVIKAEIETYQLANISPALNVEADSVMGQVNAIVAAKIAELWEVAQAVYASQYADSAEGVPLDNVGALTGAVRLPATKSTVTLTCTGTPATVLPVGRVVSVDPGGDRFVSLAEGIIGGGGTVNVEFEAEEFGAIVANAGTLTVIETAVAGWASVTNALDADVGREIESDEDFRQRRVALLEASGDATPPAIRAEVLSVEDVTECIVFENTSDVTDGDGLPPHSIEVVVRGGDDDEILQAIFNSKAAGIYSHGVTVTGVITDTEGVDHDIRFSRPDELVLEINVTVDTDDDFPTTPVTGEDLIAAALAAYATEIFDIGVDVLRNKLFAAIYDACPGIVDVTTLEIRFNPPGGAFVTTSLSVSAREIATLDTGDVTVTT